MTLNKSNIAISLIIASLAVLSSCIHNIVPYPKLPQNIIAIAAEGEDEPAVINDEKCQVEIFLNESTDPHNVRFTEFEYTEGAECSQNLLEGTYDLTKPLSVTLSLYQSYQWIITANQVISRSVVIEGQIGDAEIDVIGQRVIVKVPDTFNLAKLNLQEFKLGPADVTTMVPDIRPGEVDFSKPLEVAVTYFGQTYNWTVYVEKTHAVVTTVSADAWSKVIWAVANAAEDADVVFQYHAVGSDEWIDLDSSHVTRVGGVFTACIPHLTPLTEYVVRATADGNIGNELHATTQATTDLVDGSFDQWWLDGKVWFPFNQDGVQYWDTGNTGAATLGQSNVQPSDYTPTGSGKSAKLETKFVGIGAVGKLAAGSIYTGKFAKVDGTNGIIDFGREFNLRPTKLKGYYQYTTAPINYASAEYDYLKGRPDSCHIYIALTDWTTPYQIRTNPKNRQLFDKNSPDVIAYGEIICGDSFDGYKPFEIKLEYRSTSRIPRYIQITCAASKFGDFFTGGTGACLYVDELSFDFDY